MYGVSKCWTIKQCSRFFKGLLFTLLLITGCIIFSSPVYAAENLVNSSFEEETLIGWQVGTVSDSVTLVGNESFTYPYNGSKMVRLGTPATKGQAIGSNELYQDFDVKNPNLRFAYNLFTYDTNGYDQFYYKVIDLSNNTEVATYSQTAWGSKAALKSTGWKTVNIDVSRYVGKNLRLIINAGGTNDNSLATWAYIDGIVQTSTDNIAPATEVMITPALNSEGWTKYDVTVSLAASDNPGGIGVKEIHYRINGESETIVSGRGTSISLSEEGNWMVSYWAVDEAGNTEFPKEATIKIDKSVPVITSNQTPLPNENGWQNADIKIDFNATDVLSGIKSIDNPSIVITTEGENQIVSATATDIAGNAIGATASVNIDKTAPVTTATLNGDKGELDGSWYVTPVTVNFNADDSLSGVTYTEYSLDKGMKWSIFTTPLVVETEGHNIIYFRSVDKALNVEATKILSVDIDRSGLRTYSTLSPQTPNGGAGWYISDVTLSLAGTSSSGISKIEYSIDQGQTWLLYDQPVIFSNDGQYNIMYRSTNGAGRVEEPKLTSFKIDKTSPQTTDNAPLDWMNSDVHVFLTPIDAGSGAEMTFYSLDGGELETGNEVLVTGEGFHKLTYFSKDQAGNQEAEKTVTIRIDLTPPVIAPEITSSANEFGWYNHDITVKFKGTDPLSGIASEDVITVKSEGANQSVTGTATDEAGNVASFTVENINIDKTKPEITINTPIDGNEYLFNAIVPADWMAVDTLSEINSVSGTVPVGTVFDTSSVGIKTLTVEATDKAGNQASESVTYYVRYNFIGLLEPIRDGKIFKGNTVPIKFMLTDAQNNSAPNAAAWLYITGPDGKEIEASSTSNAVEGNLFRYDPSDQQYIFNMNIRDLQAGIWQLRVALDDGSSKYATIELLENGGPPPEKPKGNKEPGAAEDANIISLDSTVPVTDNPGNTSNNPDDSSVVGENSEEAAAGPDDVMSGDTQPQSETANPDNNLSGGDSVGQESVTPDNTASTVNNPDDSSVVGGNSEEAAAGPDDVMSGDTQPQSETASPDNNLSGGDSAGQESVTPDNTASTGDAVSPNEAVESNSSLPDNSTTVNNPEQG